MRPINEEQQVSGTYHTYVNVNDTSFCYETQQTLPGECDTVLLLDYNEPPPSVILVALEVRTADKRMLTITEDRPGRACTIRITYIFLLVARPIQNHRSMS